ncbi:MAG: hypothetical protein U0Q20_11305 [Mycobacterium sp.]
MLTRSVSHGASRSVIDDCLIQFDNYPDEAVAIPVAGDSPAARGTFSGERLGAKPTHRRSALFEGAQRVADHSGKACVGMNPSWAGNIFVGHHV